VIIDSKVSSVGFKATLFSDDDKYSWSESLAWNEILPSVMIVGKVWLSLVDQSRMK
jgi:hypothetical protein